MEILSLCPSRSQIPPPTRSLPGSLAEINLACFTLPHYPSTHSFILQEFSLTLLLARIEFYILSLVALVWGSGTDFGYLHSNHWGSLLRIHIHTNPPANLFQDSGYRMRPKKLIWKSSLSSFWRTSRGRNLQFIILCKHLCMVGAVSHCELAYEYLNLRLFSSW